MAKEDARPSIEQEAYQNTGEPASGHERRLPRFFVSGPLAVNKIVAVDELAPQLARVLRMQPGDELVLLDGSGQEYRSRLLHLDRRAGRAQVLAAQACLAEPHVHLTLYQCSLKQDKFEWVLQKGTELGVSHFVPVISERSIVRPAQALIRKYERWRAIVREAAEQCGRGHIPELSEPLDWHAAVTSAQGVRLLPWEEAQAMPSLSTVLQRVLQIEGSLSILIGPEGGVSEQEAHLAQMHGWECVSLGPRILRAETAALVAVAITLAPR
jgi:16S rRNA (uracil1498-N3)-methyltransferase